MQQSSSFYFEIIKNEQLDLISEHIIIPKLIDIKVNLKSVDFDKKETFVPSDPTPVMIAAYLGSEPVFNLLLAHGADTQIQDQIGVFFLIFFILLFLFS